MADNTTAESFIIESLDGARKSLDKLVDGGNRSIERDLIHSLSLNRHFAVAALLESLRRRDPERADEMAVWLTDAIESGDTVAEMVDQWRGELARGHHMTMVGPDPAMPAPPAEAKSVQITLSAGPVEVLGVATSTPGLIATQKTIPPVVEGDRDEVLAGSWSVTHEASGLRIVSSSRGSYYPLDVVQVIAERLGELGVDWTQPKGAFASGEHQLRVRDVLDEFDGCEYHTDADHLPVAPFRQEVASRG